MGGEEDMDRKIPETINEVIKALQQLINTKPTQNKSHIPIPLQKLKNYARETYQDIYREDIKEIIRKLKTKQQLNNEEMSLMEQWMIGDLEMYAVIEKHYDEWIQNLNEFSTQLKQFENPTIVTDESQLLALQGLIIEIEHNLHDLEKFQYVMDRIKRYKQYVGVDTSSLTDTQRYHLSDILQEMIRSTLH